MMDFEVFRLDASVRNDVPRVRDVPSAVDVPDPTDVQEFDAPDPIDAPNPIDRPNPLDVPNGLDVPNVIRDAADVPNVQDVPNFDRPNPVDIPNPIVDVPSDVPNPCTGPIVVNEVQTQGANGGTDEWVEIHNAGNCEVSLSGWTLVYRSSSGLSANIIFPFAGADRLAANSQMVIAGIGYMMANASIRRFVGGGGIAQAAGGVGLLNAVGVRVDSMVWGPVAAGHPFAEPIVPLLPPGAPITSHSLGRIPNGRDTNDNLMDFRDFAVPTPGTPNL